jgi:hypothetical protein
MSLLERRPPPAFQEYASDMLANSKYRMMSLAEKGLFDLLRRECWVNHEVPFEKPEMASYLGIPISDIEKNLTHKVLSFFQEKNQFLTCPELDNYKQGLKEKHEKMANGGRNGGKRTQYNHKSSKAPLEATLKPLRRAEQNGDELNKEEKRSLKEELSITDLDQWARDYEAAPEFSISYLKASKGY